MNDQSPPPDVKATNPRYRGMMMSDVVRKILRPRGRKARETLEKLWNKERSESDSG